MSHPQASERITLLSFRTFGDYVLKAPFLCELFRRHPHAEVTILTNRKGGEVYPLLDSRLKIVVVDHGDSKTQLLGKILRIPRADVVYALDDSRTTLILSLLTRGRRKTGWVQGRSRLYAKDGYFEWKSVSPWLSSIMRLVFHPGRIRLPEDAYEGDVELELLDAPRSAQPLSSYRSPFAFPPATRPERGYFYCAAEAGWVARQLTVEQWKGVIGGLLAAFPGHSIVVHGAAGAASAGSSGMLERVVPYTQGSIRNLFEIISAADLVIAPDSFALHLASLYNVPAIGYFGPAHPHRFRPTGPGSRSLFRQPECSPCLQMRGTSPCAKGLTQCVSLSQLTPADFIEAAETALLLVPRKTMFMPIAALTLELRIESARSLKDRRQVVRSLKDKLRHGFNISVAELDEAVTWQSATLGVAAISGSRDYLAGLMQQVEHAATRIANELGAVVADAWWCFAEEETPQE